MLSVQKPPPSTLYLVQHVIMLLGDGLALKRAQDSPCP